MEYLEAYRSGFFDGFCIGLFDTALPVSLLCQRVIILLESRRMATVNEPLSVAVHKTLATILLSLNHSPQEGQSANVVRYNFALSCLGHVSA